jgi:hypothetical protein
MTELRKLKGVISTVNSSAVPLPADTGGNDHIFTGVAEDVTDFGTVEISVYSDVASATDGLSIEYSSDGINWDHTDVYTVPAATGKNYSIQRVAKWFRIIYTNGVIAQTEFRLQVIFNQFYIKPSSHRIQDTITDEDDAELVKAVIAGPDENEVFQNARVNSEGFLITGDFFLEIAEGRVAGHSIYRKFGRIASIQTATPADCWEFGITPGAELYTWSTTEAIDSISSSDAGDTEEITITMLDIDYVEFTQIAVLDGQNRVAITPGFRFNRAYNSNGTPTAGNVYIYENTALSGGVPIDVTLVRGYISINGQQTLQSMYTVPAGKNAFLYELKTSMGGRKTGFATYEAFLRTVGSIFLIKDTHDLSATGTSYANDIFTAPRLFPEKTDFQPKITVDTNSIGFAVSFVIILVDN